MKGFWAMVILLCWSFLCGGCAGEEGLGRQPVKEIRIGMIVDLSGAYGIEGSIDRKAVEMAIEESNRKNLIPGYKIKLVVGDNRSDEAETVRVYKALVQVDKVVAVIGPDNSDEAIPLAPVADELKVPFIATMATNPRVTVTEKGETRPFAFRPCFIDTFQGEVLARAAWDELNARTAVIYCESGSEYSKDLGLFFRREFEKRGGKVLEQREYQTPAMDGGGSVESLLRQSPDVIFIPGFYADAARIIVRLRQEGYARPILGGDGWDGNMMTVLAGKEAMNRTYYCEHFFLGATEGPIADFRDRFVRYSQGTRILQSTVMAYDAAGLLLDGIRRAESKQSGSIREALEKTQGFAGVTGDISINGQHNGEKDAVITTLEDGKAVLWRRMGRGNNK